MQLTVTFNSLEEVNEFASRVWIAGLTEEKKPLTKEELNESAKKTTEIINAAEAKEEAEKKAKKEEAKKSSPKTEKPQEEAKTEEKEAPEESIEHAPDYTAGAGKKVTESQVKVLLSEKLKAGKKAEVKELFGKYGVEKLSELIEKHPDKLDEFYTDAEGI